PADVNSLRGRVASIVAASIVAPPYRGTRGTRGQTPRPPRPPHGSALNGTDVLKRAGFALLRGRRVGLITNQTGRDREGQSTIDLLKAAPRVTLVGLFSPEHGSRGVLDGKVPDSVDEKTGLPIYSLYGETRKPTAEMLNGLDALVYDIQDIGTRYYT